jgi:hypothetical protein
VRPIATVSFKLVRTRISIGWLFPFNAGIPQKSYNSLLFSAVVFLPLYIDTNHNDVGGDAHCKYVMASDFTNFVCWIPLTSWDIEHPIWGRGCNNIILNTI